MNRGLFLMTGFPEMGAFLSGVVDKDTDSPSKQHDPLFDLVRAILERREARVNQHTCSILCDDNGHHVYDHTAYGMIPSMQTVVENNDSEAMFEERLDEEHFNYYSALGFAVYEHDLEACRKILERNEKNKGTDEMAFEFTEYDAVVGSFDALHLAQAVAQTHLCCCEEGQCKIVDLLKK